MINVVLVKKEIKQNIVIYIFPCLILAILWLVLRENHFIAPKWAGILAITFPVALGGAYGLQAFDLEENGQTRDFLLLKPLTIHQILWTKFCTGLLFLVPITLLWLQLLNPKSLQWPNMESLANFWGLTVMVIVLLIYIVAFTISILIKGQLKIVSTIAVLPLIGAWFFSTWGQLLTSVFWLTRNQLIRVFLLFFITLLLLAWVVFISHRLSWWYIAQLPFLRIRKLLYSCIAICAFLPLIFTGLNYVFKPSIYPFNQLAASLIGIEEWFVAEEGIRQPGGNQYLFKDIQGRIGIVFSGGKPEEIYKSSRGPSRKPNTLTNLTWSPNGEFIAFCESHQIKIYSLDSKTKQTIASGDIPFWSYDNKKLLVAKLLSKQKLSTQYGSVEQNKYQFSLVDLASNNSTLYTILGISGSSLAWDSLHSRFLTMDISGNLVILDLVQKKVIPYPLINGQMEPVFFSKIQPVTADSKIFEIFVYSVERSRDGSLQSKKFNLRRYLYNCENGSTNLCFMLKGQKYRDIISTNKPGQILIRSENNGIYRLIKLAKEAHQ